MRRLLAALAVVFGAGVAVAGTFSGGFTFGDGGGLAGIGLGDGTTTIGSAVPGASFDLVAGATTPNDLSDSLTVNGTAMTLVLACDAQGISGINWACRDASGAVTLAEAGTGTSPSTTVLTPFHAIDVNERAVNMNATGKYYEAATLSVGQIAAEDAIVELVTNRAPAGCPNNAWAIGTATPAIGTPGWAISSNTLCRANLTVSDGTTSVGGGGVAAIWGQSNHALFGFDTGVAVTNAAAINGAASTSSAGVVGNATSTTKFRINNGASSVVSLRIWKCANCITSLVTDIASVARYRAAVAFGVAPSIASGVAAPTALTRATTAHVDVVDGVTRSLYLTGANAPRIARRTHSGGTIVAGYMSEPASTNLALQSQTLGTTWTAITVGDTVLADQWAGADLTTTGDDVDGNNSLGEHGLRQSITLTAATHTFSAWAKAGAQTFVALRNNTILSGAAWFDVATCTSASCTIGEDCAAAVKTVQAGVIQARAQRWPIDTTGDGVADVSLCRVSIAYTGTAVAHDHDLLCAPSDGVTSYTDADAIADCGFWGVRVEAYPTMTSYLATTTASVARNADDVRFDGASHYAGDPSTMDVQVLCPNFNTETTSTFASVGTGTANYARLGIDATNDFGYGEATVTTQQWSIIAAATDVSNGVAHSLRQTMATNSIQAYVDGTSIGTDTLATLPTSASSFVYLGTAGSTASQPACLISRTRLWPAIVTPAVSP